MCEVGRLYRLSCRHPAKVDAGVCLLGVRGARCCPGPQTMSLQWQGQSLCVLYPSLWTRSSKNDRRSHNKVKFSSRSHTLEVITLQGHTMQSKKEQQDFLKLWPCFLCKYVCFCYQSYIWWGDMISTKSMDMVSDKFVSDKAMAAVGEMQESRAKYCNKHTKIRGA